MPEPINPTQAPDPAETARNGAGRKIGSQSKGTISAAELRDKLLRTGESPLEVLVDGMRQAKNRHAKIEAKLEQVNQATLDTAGMKALTELVAQAKQYLIEARGCAKEAAPYLHPRLEPVGRFIEINLPTIKTAADIADAQGVVIAAVAAGELTTEEGAKMSGILESRRRAIETSDLEQRIAALEGAKK